MLQARDGLQAVERAAEVEVEQQRSGEAHFVVQPRAQGLEIGRLDTACAGGAQRGGQRQARRLLVVEQREQPGVVDLAGVGLILGPPFRWL